MTSVQEIRKQLKPIVSEEEVRNTFSQHWSHLCSTGANNVKVKALDSYDDANFYIALSLPESEGQGGSINKTEFLMKFYNAMETAEPDILYGLSLMLNRLTDRLSDRCLVSSIIPPTSSMEVNPVDLIFYKNCMLANGSQQAVAVRVFQWIAGDTLSNYLSSSGTSLTDTSQALFEQLGNALGLMFHALKDLDHPSFHRSHLWDLAQFPNVASLITYTQDDQELYDHIVSLQSIYQIMTEAVADKLPKSLIMGDANDANVIVKDNHVAGLIDFSDAIVTWSINELAIAMAYGLVSGSHSGSYLEVVSAIFSGYVKHRVLNEQELLMLPMLMATRLATSVMVGAYSISKEPENEYLKLHALPARKSLKFWMTTDRSGADVAFQQHTIYFQRLQDSIIAANH